MTGRPCVPHRGHGLHSHILSKLRLSSQSVTAGVEGRQFDIGHCDVVIDDRVAEGPASGLRGVEGLSGFT